MSTKTYSICPKGHKMYYSPNMGCTLREWWCIKCNKGFPLLPQEKRLVMVAYRYGRECGKSEARNAVKAALGIY